MRSAFPVEFHPQKEGDEWQGDSDKSICPESPGNIPVQERMKHPLAPASHTLQPREPMKHTLGHEGERSGIHCKIKYGAMITTSVIVRRVFISSNIFLISLYPLAY